MSTVQEIETVIHKLKPQKIHEVADWLQGLRGELWDQQIEADAKTGRLDKAIAKAGYRAGEATTFP